MFIDMQFSSPLGKLRDLRKSDDVCVCVCVRARAKKWSQLSQNIVLCWMCVHYNKGPVV